MASQPKIQTATSVASTYSVSDVSGVSASAMATPDTMHCLLILPF